MIPIELKIKSYNLYAKSNIFYLFYVCSHTFYIATVIVTSPSSGISKGALAGIVLGAIAFVVTFSAIVTILVLRIRLRDHPTPSKRAKGEYLKMNNLACDYFF